MKRFGLFVGVVVLPLGLMTYACDDTVTGTGGATSGSTTAKTTTGSMVTTSTKASSSSGTPDCTGLGDFAGDPCGPCLEANCCAELAAAADPSTDPDLGACADASCNAECFPPPPEPVCGLTIPAGAGACVTINATDKCNPITNEGCNTAMGEACDVNADGFECYPAPNDKLLCEACGTDEGFCAGGMTCVGKCAAYCCSDADCGTGTCTKGGFANPNVGFCEATMTTTTTTATTAASSSSTGP